MLDIPTIRQAATTSPFWQKMDQWKAAAAIAFERHGVQRASATSRVVGDDKTLTGILCVFDTLEREMEIKILITCSQEDIHAIQKFHSDIYLLYIPNPKAEP